MSKSHRYIPGTTFDGVTRGGGSEWIEWVRNGPMRLYRDYTYYTLGLPLTSYYVGGAIRVSVPTLPSGSPDSDNTVKQKGDSAIGMARPSSPSVNILTSAGEIASEGLPKPPDLIRWRKSLGDLLATGVDSARDYVAWNFSWKPLEREIRDYYKQVVRTNDIVKSARSPVNSRIIRVGHNYPTTESNSTTTGTLNAVGWVSSSGLGNLAPGGTSKQMYSRVWFEGKYLYFHPFPKEVEKTNHDASDYAKHVLGLQLTPQVLWDLAPWSWFADWMLGTDALMNAASSTLADGMVPVEAFTMHTHSREAITAATGPHMSGDGKIARFSPASVKVVSETKLRFISTPYLGFGGTGELTASQISILAALGISRA